MSVEGSGHIFCFAGGIPVLLLALRRHSQAQHPSPAVALQGDGATHGSWWPGGTRVAELELIPG